MTRYSIIVAFLFCIPVVVHAGPAEKPIPGAREAKAAAPKPGAGMPTDWKQFVEQRQADLLEINSHLYELNEKEQAQLRTMVEKFGEKSALSDPGRGAELMKLSLEREALITRLGGESADAKALEAMHSHPAFRELDARIQRVETGLVDAATVIQYSESLVDKERAAAAHAEWEERLLRARGSVVIRGLVDQHRDPVFRTKHAKIVEAGAPHKPAGRMTDVSRVARRATQPPAPAGSGGVKPPKSAPPPVKKSSEAPPAPTKADAAKPRTSSAMPSAPAKTAPAAKAKPVPLDKWEQYVRDFLAESHATAEQSNSALAILADLKHRAEQYRQTARKQFEAAEAMGDKRRRQERLDALNGPVERLFEQLKHRLESLLTSEQRALRAAAKAPAKKR